MRKKVVLLGLALLLVLTGCSNKKSGVVIYSSMEEERNKESRIKRKSKRKISRC